MKSKFSLLSLLAIVVATMLFTTCSKDKGVISNGFPPEVNHILQTKCATPGCHTTTSKEAASGLSLQSWDELFQGDRNGAACIPFRHDYSTLFLFTNNDPTKGAINNPLMPYNKPPLSKAEMEILTNWINAGAPNSDGKIAFSGNSNRSKVYVTNQACDVVTVFDAATQLQMRYVDVGVSPQIESPHMIKVSPDGKYWYTVFSAASTVLQKYRASDDSYVGAVTLPVGSWNTLTISNDSKHAFAVDWNPDGKIAYIDLESMTLLGGSPWSGFWDAHGSAINPGGDTLYVTAQLGNYIHKIPVNDPGSFEQKALNPPAIPSPTSLFDPHEIAFSPDNLHYFVTCQRSNEVRVMRISDDGLAAAIPVGAFPQEMSFSKTKPYLFVTCEYDSTGPSTNRGSVTVIDYTTLTKVANLRINMSEPHGIAVDDANNLVYVANRNISTGSIPHHTSNCGGTNGFISFINLNTLQVIQDKRIELAADPYSIAVRP